MFEDLYVFIDRADAGEKLAAKLLEEPVIQEAVREELLVLSIPRGGVVVGAVVARELGCSHDVIAVKKIGYPGHKELAIGAMAEDGTLVLNPHLTSQFDHYVEQAMKRASNQVKTVIRKFRQRRVLDVESKIVIVVDDGIATGETVKAAVIWLRSKECAQRPKKVIVAVPVSSPRAAREIQELSDEFVCLYLPQRFWAVGQFYWDFDQVSDEAAREYLPHSAAAP